MMILAAYDISADGRRSRLAALLQSVGDRVQESVFVVDLPPEEVAGLRTRAAALIDPDEDSLFFFRQCATCWSQVDTIGQAEPPEQVLCWTVL